MSEKMECVECENPKAFEGKRVVHKYIESGLDYVTLTGVTEFKCPECGAVYLEIPKLRELNKTIAEAVIQKKTFLTGREIRFLRKELGYSTEAFARVIQYDPKSLSRIENGHQKVNPSFDRLVRLTYGSKQRDLDYNLHDAVLDPKLTFKRLEMKASPGRTASQFWNLRIPA